MTEVGYYSISYQVLALPLLLISSNVSRVFLKKISEDYGNKKSMFANFTRIVKNLGLLSVITFSILAIFAPMVSEYVFGKGYEETGKYIAILSFLYAFRFIASSISGAFVIYKKQKYSLLFNTLISIAGGLIFIIVKIACFNIYTYFTIISIVYGAIYLAVIVCIGYISRKIDIENSIMGDNHGV
jgi:O-antigen/teichoic acid export membrane protein